MTWAPAPRGAAHRDGGSSVACRSVRYSRQMHAVFLLLAAAGPTASAADPRQTVVISDLHLGGEGSEPGAARHAYEDFRWTDDFAAFLDGVDTRAGQRGWPVDLVIAGDMFELWQSTDGSCRSDDPALGCSEIEATARLRRILAVHQADIQLLAQFAQKPDRRVVILPGNHDAALLLPGTRAALLEAFARYPGADVIVDEDGAWLNADGAVLVEHGHQSDPANRFRGWPTPWRTDAAGLPRLERPWGEWFVLDLFDGLERRWPTVDNTTDDVGVATWLWDYVPWSERASTAWTILGVGKTVEQKFDIAEIGEGEAAEWDVPAMRERGDAALWALEDPRIRSPQAPQGDALVASLSDTELEALCGAAAAARASDAPDPCPRPEATTASHTAGALPGASARRLGEYLGRRSKELGLARPYAYVFGHTHAAVEDIAATGAPFQVVLNDGAFQRVVEVDVLKARAGEGSPPPALATMTPEVLPACYSFVEIAPYGEGQTPSPKGRYWVQTSSGKWKWAAYRKRPEGCPRG